MWLIVKLCLLELLIMESLFIDYLSTPAHFNIVFIMLAVVNRKKAKHINTSYKLRSHLKRRKCRFIKTSVMDTALGALPLKKAEVLLLNVNSAFTWKKAHHADLIWFSSDFWTENPSKAQQEIGKWINCVRKLFGDAENRILFWWLNSIEIVFKDKFISILEVSCFKLWTQDMI